MLDYAKRYSYRAAGRAQQHYILSKYQAVPAQGWFGGTISQQAYVLCSRAEESTTPYIYTTRLRPAGAQVTELSGRHNQFARITHSSSLMRAFGGRT